jgi:hypothetical protein
MISERLDISCILALSKQRGESTSGVYLALVRILQTNVKKALLLQMFKAL